MEDSTFVLSCILMHIYCLVSFTLSDEQKLLFFINKLKATVYNLRIKQFLFLFVYLQLKNFSKNKVKHFFKFKRIFKVFVKENNFTNKK